MLEGISDQYRLLDGSDERCKGYFSLCRKGESVVRIGYAKSYKTARCELSWCQNALSSISTLWPSVNSHRRTFSRPNSSIRLCPLRYAYFVRLPFKEIRRCRQTSSFVKKRLLARAAGSRFVHCSCGRFRMKEKSRFRDRDESYLVDPASSHMLVSKIKPCMSKYKLLYCETANGSLNQLSSI